MKSKKFLISAFIFIVLAAGIVAGVLLVQNNQDIREKAAPATNLSFFPSTQTKSPGETINLTINADTGENRITAVDIEISFDPAVIQLTNMSALPAISSYSVLTNGIIDNTAGTARYAAFNVDRSTAQSGSLDIISLTGTIVNGAADGTATIDFSSMTAITAVDEGVDVIVNKTPATITVSASGGGATATASPSPTPTTAGGVGGAGITLPTATPLRTATPSPTTAAAVPTSTATLPPVPVTGVSVPFMVSLVLGLGAIIFSLSLAF